MRCPFRGLGRKRREQTHGQPSISGFVLLAKHLAVKNSGERRRLACPLKLKAEADPQAREKTQLEQSGFDLMMIEPRSHLRHGAAQIRAGARYLDYVHAVLAPRVGACGII